jgi:mono/diheme cytochrome c family protein
MRIRTFSPFNLALFFIVLQIIDSAVYADIGVKPSRGTPAQSVADQSWRPTYANTPYPNVSASSDPRVIAEGEYLFHAVGQCTSCHLPRDKVAFVSAEQMRRLLPSGGQEWDMGPIGVIRSANITPDRSAGIGTWTDREIARAIKYAVNRDGRALFFMNGLGSIDDHDLTAIVSYLKTLAPVPQKVARTQITVEGIQTLRTKMQGWLEPRPQTPVDYVAPGETSVRRGAYLANGPARCIHCHSSLLDSPHIALDGPAFAGSQWAQPDGDNPAMEINAPNLTPSNRFGHIAQWSQDAFIGRFRAGRALKWSDMPWENFRLMTDSDLASLYLYLRSLPPVDRNVGPSYRPKGWKPDPSQ